MLDVDGNAMSGSGMIVRDAMAYAATACARRPNAGLRPQHLCAVEAVRRLGGGTVEGARVGSREFTFVTGDPVPQGSCWFDVGTAGSTTAMSLALLPVVAAGAESVDLQFVGGLFQDQARLSFPSGACPGPHARPDGAGGVGDPGSAWIRPDRWWADPLADTPRRGTCRARGRAPAPGTRLWGIALASPLVQWRVASRMAQAARDVLGAAGYDNVLIDEVEDVTAFSPRRTAFLH